MSKVDELVKRVRLTDDELINEGDKVCEEYKIRWGDWSVLKQAEMEQFIMRLYETMAEAQLKKVLNDPDLAVIDRGSKRKNRCVQHVIPLAEALKEEQDE